jgi:D-alanyl-D-alanine dipeptidase
LLSGSFFSRVCPYLIVCGCLAAAESTPPTNLSAADEPSGWSEMLSNLPMLLRLPPFSLDIAPLATIHLTQPIPSCSVAVLPEVEDPAALAFENGTGTEGAVDLDGLSPAMGRALARFRQLVSSVGGSLDLKSAYRPPAYQAHLQAVWFKWMLELRNNREPVCQLLRAQVGQEFERHRLLETQKPVTSSDHTRGLAFDATVVMPKVARLKKRRVSLDRLALLAGITRPDIRRDPVHYKLVLRTARHG